MYEAYDWIIGLDRAGARRRSVAGRCRSGSISTRTTNGIIDGPTIPMGHHEYRPLADMLVEIAERGTKSRFPRRDRRGRVGQARHGSTMSATRCARRMRRGADVRGICWYPITAYPGWDNSPARRDTGSFQPSSRTAAATSIERAARRVRASARLFVDRPERSARPRVGDAAPPASRLTEFRR